MVMTLSYTTVLVKQEKVQALSFVLLHYLHNDGPENQISIIRRVYQLTLLEEHKLIKVLQGEF